MKSAVVWKNEMAFEGHVGNHMVLMDSKAPLGKDAGATPKELVALGMGGCTAMDVIALLKKYKQAPRSFQVDVDIETTQGGFPVVFEKAMLSFVVEGDVLSDKLIEAVRLSQTKYCGVNAMLSKALPIEYRIVLNGQEIAKGKADFESKTKESV